MNETLIQWGIGIAVTTAVAAFFRFCPKQKLMDWIGPVMFGLGKTLSILGNARIGKKAMNKVEEGPLSTLIGVAMHGLVEFGRGLVSDNSTDENKEGP